MSRLTMLEGTPQELAWIALAYQLHNPHRAFVLRIALKMIVNMERAGWIVLAKVDNHPAGVMVVFGGQVMAFTLPQYRRMGVGRLMTEQVVAQAAANGAPTDEWYAIPPDDQGFEFFRAVGIDVSGALEERRICS